MKKKEQLFVLNPNRALIHASILEYCQTEFVRTVWFNDEKDVKRYMYQKDGQDVQASGVKRLTKKYVGKFNVGKGDFVNTTVFCGSSVEEGILVDEQLKKLVLGTIEEKDVDILTLTVWNYWRDRGHVVQVLQLPVQVFANSCMTQIDAITMDPNGNLCFFEVKCGGALEVYVSDTLYLNGVFDMEGKPIKCSKEAEWQLQLHYCMISFKATGILIENSLILQVFKQKHTLEPFFRERLPADWLQNVNIKDERLPYNPQVNVKVEDRVRVEVEEIPIEPVEPKPTIFDRVHKTIHCPQLIKKRDRQTVE